MELVISEKLSKKTLAELLEDSKNTEDKSKYSNWKFEEPKEKTPEKTQKKSNDKGLEM